MQDEQFDDLIRRKLSESRSTPPPMAFERIRTSLPERKRRFAWWYWLPALLLLMSAGLGYFIFDSTNTGSLRKNTVIENHSTNNESNTVLIPKPENDGKSILEKGKTNMGSVPAASFSKTGDLPETISRSSKTTISQKAVHRITSSKKPVTRNSEAFLVNQELVLASNDQHTESKHTFSLTNKIPGIVSPALPVNKLTPTLLDTAGMKWAYPMPEKERQALRYEPFASVKWSSRNISIQSAEQMDVQKQSGFSASRFQYEAGLNLHKQVSPFMSVFGGISINYLQDQTSVVHHATTTLPCQLYQSADGNMHLLPQPEAHNLTIRYQSMMVGGQAGVALQLTSNWAIWGNGRLHRQWKNSETAKAGEIKAQLHTTWMPSAAFGLSHTLLNKNGYRFSIDPLLEIYPKGAIRVGNMYQSRPMFFGLRASVMLQ